MTRFTSYQRSSRTSANWAEASSCAKMYAAMGTAFAVSIFVLALLALRLQGLVLAALITIAIIISIIMVRSSKHLSERTQTVAA